MDQKSSSSEARLDPGDPTLQLDDPPPPPQGSLTDDDAFAFIQGETFAQEIGRAVAVADFDGDGLADLAIGAAGNPQGDVIPDPGVRSGRVYLFRGPITEQIEDLSQADTILYGAEHFSGFGAAVAAGDLDGDGFADLVVSDLLATFVFYGPIEDGLRSDAEADARIDAQAASQGRHLLPDGEQPLGDFDGDGDMDIALINWNGGFLFFDAPEGEVSAADATGSLAADSSWNIRYEVATGDLNADGRDELVAQTQGEGAYNYSLHVFYGPFSGARSAEAADVVLEDVREGLSIVADDLNFDGVPDMVCGQPGFMDFPDNNEERGVRPHGAVQLFAGGRD
jgi:hypothetical protein